MTRTYSVPTFARDQAHFLKLCDEIIARLEEHGDERMPPPVQTLVAELDFLGLAGRMGFPVRTPFYSEQPTAARKTEPVVIWNDPRGAEAGHLHFDAVPHPSFDPKCLPASFGSKLHKIMKRWRRAVADLNPPARYPALPSQLHASADREFSRDPFWNRLFWSVEVDISRHADAEGAFSLEAWPEFMWALNVLSKYEGESEVGMFTVQTKKGGFQVALCIENPLGGEAIALPFENDGSLANRGVNEFKAAIRMWMKRRAQHLDAIRVADEREQKSQQISDKSAAPPKGSVVRTLSTDNQVGILKALHELGALDAEHRKTAIEIAVHRFGDARKADYQGDVCATMVKRGWLQSKRSRGGGYHILPEGLLELKTRMPNHPMPRTPNNGE